MARAKRNSDRRQRGAGRGLPGWAMMTIGLIIGLFVAFLVYLDDLDSPPATSVEQSRGPSAEGEEKASARDQTNDDDTEESQSPEFEFYSILPDLEVVVPDHPKDKAEKDTGSSTGESEGQEQPPVPTDDGPFYLQAGSFQKADQADRMKARIALLGLDVAIQQVEINGDQWHRVRVGPYSDPDKLRSAQKRLRSNGIDYLVLRKKSSG